MADSWIRTRHLWLPNRSDDFTLVLIKVLTALQKILRAMSISRKRTKTPTTELNTFLSKNNFRQKIVNH